ncbi:MAG: DNA-directed RNA polymerase subunit P [Candidatus Aenigmarchaeota archaeon]|nr:DNA-directed RNA polymerase subunit P [Candidatus Aenigmarchaeota archaeon]
MYKCIACKKITTKMEDTVRCSYCGQRVFLKLRPEIIKRVVAR